MAMSGRPHSTLELSELQLADIAGRVPPEEWGELGVRLGFDYSRIQQMKANYHKNIKEGILYMLTSWLKMHPASNQPDARKHLASQFDAMGLAHLAVKLTNSERDFSPPEKVRLDCSSKVIWVDFSYHRDVRTFEIEHDVTFQCMLSRAQAGLDNPVNMCVEVLHQIDKDHAFSEQLSACMHALGVRLTRIQATTDTGNCLQITVTTSDIEGAQTLRKNLLEPKRLADDLTKKFCQYVRGFDRSNLKLELRCDDAKLQAVIKSITREEESASSGTVPSQVSPIELVSLARVIPAGYVQVVGMGLGLPAAYISQISAEEGHCRVVLEKMLFKWLMSKHPLGEHRAKLTKVLDDAGLILLAGNIRSGAYREKKREEQRRIHLQRASAPVNLRGMMLEFSHPKVPTDQPPSTSGDQSSPTQKRDDHKNKLPTLKCTSPPHADTLSEPSRTLTHPQYDYVHKTDPSPSHRQHEYVNIPNTSTGHPQHDYMNIPNTSISHLQHDYGNLPGTPPSQPHHDSATDRHPRSPSVTTADTPSEHEYANLIKLRGATNEHGPDYARVSGSQLYTPGESSDTDYHDYENESRLTSHQRANITKRNSFKKFGSHSIPALHELDLSVIEPMWPELYETGVIGADILSPAGLTKLAQALDLLKASDIADILWAALIKDRTQHFFLSSFVTGHIELRARVITNNQPISEENTTLEHILSRTKDRAFPTRIFIEAGSQEDRELIGQTLGYEWANEKNKHSALGNVDMLFVLRVDEITSGSSIGGAITEKCVRASGDAGESFPLDAHRVETYLANTSTEYVIVLIGDNDGFARLMTSSTGNGFGAFILGNYLPNCIVIMTVGPNEQNKKFAYYKLVSSASRC